MDKTYGSAVPQAPSIDEMRLELERREPKINYWEVAKDLGGQLKDQTIEEIKSLAEPRGVTDVINKGYIASLLGIPADLGNLPFQAIDAITGLTNYPTKLAPEAPVGGSKWWGSKMTDAGFTTPTERPVLEIASSFLSPRLATKGAELTGKALEAGAKSLAPKFADLYESGHLTSLPFSSPETRNFFKPTLDIFAGEKAVGADLDMLAEAKRRVKAKEDPALVWKETGWGKDPTDKKWKFEIDTSGSRYEYAPALAEQQVAHGKLATSVDISYDMANLMERRGMSKQKAIEYVTREYGRPPTAGEIGNAENMSASDLFDMRMEAAKQKPTEDTFKAKNLGDVYQSPALAAYPELSTTPLQHRPLSEMKNTLGSVHPVEGIKLNEAVVYQPDSSRSLKTPRSVLEHELQHQIQRKEGWAPGGSQEAIEGDPGQFSSKVKRAQNMFVNAMISQGGRAEQLAKLWDSGKMTSADIKEFNDLANIHANRELTGYAKARRSFLGRTDPFTGQNQSFQRYQELGGEANARLSQARLEMDAQKRRENYPWNPFNFFKDTGVPVSDVINNPPKKAEGGVLHMADAGAVNRIIQAGAGALKAARQRALPIDIPRAAPMSDADMMKEVDRIARQQNDEFIKGKTTSNLAGYSKAESERLKNTDYNLEPLDPANVAPTPTPVYEKKLGDVDVAIPGDISISDKVLVDVNGIPLLSHQQGGPYFGEGKKNDAIPLFWASNYGTSRNLQNRINELAQRYETDRIMGHHLGMGQDSMNFAMHFADANIAALTHMGIPDGDLAKITEGLRNGYKFKNQKTKEYEYVTFPDFPGFDDPSQAYKYMQANPEMRKFFNDRMKTKGWFSEPPEKGGLGLPAEYAMGNEIQYAISEPALRNMEKNLTGLSVGQMSPNVPLTETANHATYTHGIPGLSVGRAQELAPFMISHPDAYKYFTSQAHRNPKDLTGTIQKVFPHQVVDQQHLDQMNNYYTKLRQVRGFKEGGEIEDDDLDAMKLALQKKGEPIKMGRGSSVVSAMMDKLAKTQGSYAARRLERAADEIPNLEKLYEEQAILRAFGGDNAQAVMTMKPSDFEKYAAPLGSGLSDRSLQNIVHLTNVQNNGGFSDVPYLNINKKEQGTMGLPFISGHEGRHRNRAMDAAGEQAGLVQLVPRSELREPFPRRSKEEYLEALYKEMQLTGNRVRPESYYLDPRDEKPYQRRAIELPDFYAEGGNVTQPSPIEMQVEMMERGHG
jgi:hypothetical protein